ncbi:MAG: gamma-glutamylcyclotransferase family protein [Chloroflexota bacterium]
MGSAELYDQVLSRLDFLEGYDPADPEDSDYRQVKRIVTLSGGSSLVAWVYLGSRALVTGRSRIETTWIDHIRHKQGPLTDWWRTVEKCVMVIVHHLVDEALEPCSITLPIFRTIEHRR